MWKKNHPTKSIFLVEESKTKSVWIYWWLFIMFAGGKFARKFSTGPWSIGVVDGW